MIKKLNEQEKFWSSSFENKYISRNNSQKIKKILLIIDYNI